MNMKPVAAALAAGGVIAASGAGAWGVGDALHGRDASAAPAVPSAAPAPVAIVAASAPDPPGVTPNYRQIVQANGPAVVGVTVAGTRKADAGDAAVGTTRSSSSSAACPAPFGGRAAARPSAARARASSSAPTA